MKYRVGHIHFESNYIFANTHLMPKLSLGQSLYDKKLTAWIWSGVFVRSLLYNFTFCFWMYFILCGEFFIAPTLALSLFGSKVNETHTVLWWLWYHLWIIHLQVFGMLTIFYRETNLHLEDCSLSLSFFVSLSVKWSPSKQTKTKIGHHF